MTSETVIFIPIQFCKCYYCFPIFTDIIKINGRVVFLIRDNNRRQYIRKHTSQLFPDIRYFISSQYPRYRSVCPMSGV